MAGVAIGLDQFYYAVMNDEDAETYDSPVHVPGLIQATVTPTTNSASLYGDNKAIENESLLGDIGFALVMKDLPTSAQADLLGSTVDANGVLVRKSTDVAPYVAVGYRRKLTGGLYRYVWLLKGKFQVPEQDAATANDTPAFQTPTINATFIPRETDNEWQSVVNSGDSGVDPTTITNWFNAPYIASADSTPPSVDTVVPADEATGIAVGSTVVWTFDTPVSIGGASFVLQNTTSFASIAGAVTINADKTEVTFTPDSDLTPATEYVATVSGVKDYAGNVMAPYATTFTTA